MKKLSLKLVYFLAAPSYDEIVQKEWHAYPAPKKIAQKIASVRSQQDPVIIDAGIGTGLTSLAMKRHFENASIHGYDLSSGMMIQARKKNAAQSYTSCDLDDPNVQWPSEDDIADIVVSSGAIDHMSNIVHFINEATRSLKPGGVLGLTHLVHSTAEQKRKKSSTTIHRHSLEKVREAAEMAGLDIVEHEEALGYARAGDTGRYGYLVAIKPESSI